MSAMRLGAAAVATAALAGCAGFSADGGLDGPRRLAREQFNAELKWVRTEAERASVAAEVQRLLSQPLSADSVVRVALLNNPGLQATYARLGIAQADLVQAGRLPNPVLSATRARSDGGERSRESTLLFDFGALVTMPLAVQMEQRRFSAAQASVSREVARTALAARVAYVQAVGAGEQARLMAQFTDSARVGRELAERMVQAGNWPKINAIRHQLFHAETLARYAESMKAENAAREQLARVLGIERSPRALKLPQALAGIPDATVPGEELEAIAMTRRFDVAAARFNVEGAAKALGLTKTTRFVSLLEFGPTRGREGNGERARGYEIELQVPLFDWGSARVAKAESLYMQALAEAAAVAVDARSEVRESYHAYRSAHDIARHFRDELVPLRRLIRDEQLKRYNGMLIGVFELVSDARELVNATIAAIGAQRDFWLADAQMQAAMLGVGALGAPAGAPPAPASAASGGGH